MKDRPLTVRKATRNDSRKIWEIKNHPEVRKKSSNQNFIPFEDHDGWFQNKYFKTRNNCCLVLDSDDGVLGYCRFDYDNAMDCYFISIAIRPSKHGKGLGSYLLERALGQFPTEKNIIAEIKKENKISVHLFQRNLFRKFKEDTHHCYLWR